MDALADTIPMPLDTTGAARQAPPQSTKPRRGRCGEVPVCYFRLRHRVRALVMAYFIPWSALIAFLLVQGLAAGSLSVGATLWMGVILLVLLAPIVAMLRAPSLKLGPHALQIPSLFGRVQHVAWRDIARVGTADTDDGFRAHEHLFGPPFVLARALFCLGIPPSPWICLQRTNGRKVWIKSGRYRDNERILDLVEERAGVVAERLLSPGFLRGVRFPKR